MAERLFRVESDRLLEARNGPRQIVLGLQGDAEHAMGCRPFGVEDDGLFVAPIAPGRSFWNFSAVPRL